MKRPFNEEMTMEQLMVASFALLRHRIQCDQIGLFLKVLGDKFSYKSSRKIWWLLASCEKIKTSGKKYFWSTFEKIGLLWIPSSGHTASQTSSTFISEKQQSKSKQLTLLCLNDVMIDLRHCIKDPLGQLSSEYPGFESHWQKRFFHQKEVSKRAKDGGS